MKKFVLLSICLLLVAGVSAQTLRGGQVAIENLNVARNGEALFVAMDVDLTGLQLKSSHEMVFTPALVTADHQLLMPAVVVAGRNRYYHYVRNDHQLDGRELYREGKAEKIHYQASVPFEQWMETAELVLQQDSCGCQELLMENEDLLATLDFKPRVFAPAFVYIQPEVEAVKVRDVKGQAYIDFPVNRTEIYPDYRRNPEELKKIIATIDEVKNNPDTRITSIAIKGYASPEGSYVNNTRLAKGRTATLKDYVQKQYQLAEGVMNTDFEPEDWAGLRRYVADSDLVHKQEILALIDSDRDPDNKEWKIKSTYPQEYAFLLKEVYPGLRHSDYVVEYVVRAYTDVEEAKKVLATNPGNLSLQELYMIADSYPQGSDEYNEVFATMVRLYPADEVANLNAANVAMQRKDLVSAKKYLQKAGESALAVYARGVCAGLDGDYQAARTYLEQAKTQGVKDAEEALAQIDEIEKYKK